MEMKYDHVVVGSGISGMTAALLLGLQGRKVLLLEKALHIGGSMARFRMKGIPFDTGFHFTGGFEQGGLLNDMLKILGIRDHIEPLHFQRADTNRFVFEQSGKQYCCPPTEEQLKIRLKADFPQEVHAVDEYFRLIDSVCDRTVNMDIRQVGLSPDPVEEDYISLQEVLDQLTGNEQLKTLLAAYCMCYGVKPGEVSFANHARMCQGMFRELVRIRHGGEAFVEAFKPALRDAGVEIRCGHHIVACEEIRENQVGRFRLNGGETVDFDTAIFTIHPKQVLEALPQEYFRHAFISRIADFEPSIGFFAVFGVCADPAAMEDCMVTLYPDGDLNEMFDTGARDRDSALFFVCGLEEVAGRPCRTITAFEASCPEDLAEWADSSVGRRSAGYEAYKAAKTQRIVKRILNHCPALRGNFEVLTSSSALTFRDYLHSLEGSAYGVKQKMGQFNLFGKLPLRNLYVAGQSSLLPGVMGAMMSSFIVARALVEKTQFNEFIRGRLDS